MKNVILLILVFVLTSCGTTSRIVYDISLSTVESPENAKAQFGETKIVKFSDNQGYKYRYTDDFVEFDWLVLTSRLEFVLKNKSGHTIKINWDDVSYVDYQGTVSRVMHKGVKYNEREQSQGSISIPNNSNISDIIVPTSNVQFNEGFGAYVPAKWVEHALIPCFYTSKEAMKNDIANGTWIGKTFRVMFPIEIEGIKNDYCFEFKVNKVLN